MRDDRFQVWVPRYGTIRTFAGYALFVLVVEHATGAFRATLAAVAPRVPPSLVSTGTAATLWLVLALALLAEYRRQTEPFPSFVAGDVRRTFLEQRAPAPRTLVGWLLAAVGAGAVVASAWSTFFAALDDALLVGRRLAERGTPGAFSLGELGWGVAFLVAFGVLAVAVDRLAVGVVRQAVARRGKA